ncbi:unnamed protein product [Pipistrellus nathusii]|uniref:Uncharacterized protein n=1 Tax=Pipistrellus nathusii TaxID=59473 RepID=A0ABP0A1L2_PIPNA
MPRIGHEPHPWKPGWPTAEAWHPLIHHTVHSPPPSRSSNEPSKAWRSAHTPAGCSWDLWVSLPNPCLSSGVAPGARRDVGDDGTPLHPAVVHHPGRGDGGLACSLEEEDSAVGGSTWGLPENHMGREAGAGCCFSVWLPEGNKD